ncbi:MBL fold metallo-hydrolase [Paenibacillus sp. TRM 82003]|nr:MBL fold metallo-hydrolase [Paenibacillus sp. TRM 82003]
MRTRQYEGIRQLTLMPALFPVNVYLIEEEDSVTLVDAAIAFGAERIVEAIRLTGKPLANIALTHAHDDHVGALDRLKEAFPQATVSISARDARLMAHDRGLEPGEAEAPIKGGVPKGLRARPDRLLREGDRMGSLTAVAAPGHTPGMMAFLDERTGALIAGDAFQTRGRLAVCGDAVWSFPFPAFATWHAPTAVATAEKLLRLKPSLLAVGHGDVIVDNVQERMERAIEAAKRKFGGGNGHVA